MTEAFSKKKKASLIQKLFQTIVANLATHIRLAASLEVFMDGSSFYHLYDLTFVSLHRRELETNVPKK